ERQSAAKSSSMRVFLRLRNVQAIRASPAFANRCPVSLTHTCPRTTSTTTPPPSPQTLPARWAVFVGDMCPPLHPANALSRARSASRGRTEVRTAQLSARRPEPTLSAVLCNVESDQTALPPAG